MVGAQETMVGCRESRLADIKPNVYGEERSEEGTHVGEGAQRGGRGRASGQGSEGCGDEGTVDVGTQPSHTGGYQTGLSLFE